MVVQCRALASAMGIDGVPKIIVPRMPWRWLPGFYWIAPLRAAGRGSDSLMPPWPELTISCGRYGGAMALGIKRTSGGKTFTVHIQNPQIPLQYFDVVVAPRHDHLSGRNVVNTMGSLHTITPDSLAAAARQVAHQVAHLPRPLVAVLIGGANRYYRLGIPEAEGLAALLAEAYRNYGAGFALTPSRRTSQEVIKTLRRSLHHVPHVLWDEHGENPYFGYLGLADHIVVTSDSVNMTTEACATGKPIHVFHLPGESRRFSDFHKSMENAGMTRRFTGTLESWDYPPLLESPGVARLVWERFAQAKSSAD
jgi:hypothetical protein